MHTPHGDARYRLPWTFSTFDYRELCQLLWRDCDARFETAKVNGRAGARRRRRRRSRSTPTAASISAPLVVDALGWRRMLASGDGYQPPDAPLSRGLEVHPERQRRGPRDLDRPPLRPRRLRLVLPGPATRCGSGSAPSTRASTSARRPCCWPRTSAASRVRYQGNWIPHKLRRATEGGVFFAGDSAGHCLPLSAEGIRTALYFGIALGRELRGVVEGRQSREQAAAAYAEFNDSHEWKFRWMLRVQRLIPRIPPRLLGPAIRLMGTKRFVDWSFRHYLDDRPAASSPAQRTTRKVPASSRPTPSSRSGLSATWSRPNRPRRSITTEAVSWPVTVAAATPPAPITETAISALVT